MPLYFAYGSNMDLAAMRERCPKSQLVGPARLARHRFVLMGASGYASVRRDPRCLVHGLLFDLALSDVAPLDRYEDVAHGLYVKAIRAVLPATGAARRALVYVGVDETEGGTPPPGYIEGIVAAARTAGFPAAYVASLAATAPRPAGRHPARAIVR